ERLQRLFGERGTEHARRLDPTVQVSRGPRCAGGAIGPGREHEGRVGRALEGRGGLPGDDGCRVVAGPEGNGPLDERDLAAVRVIAGGDEVPGAGAHRRPATD